MICFKEEKILFPFQLHLWGVVERLAESSKRSFTFMEQNFPCGIMSHKTRRLWDEKGGIRKR